MSKYVFAFRSDPDRAATPDEEEAWTAWFGRLGGAVTDFGNRVSRASMVTANGAGTGQDALSGYVVIAADSLDAAEALAKGCPGLQAGGRVEVGEIMEM
jgi:YCII-related domain